MTRRQTTRRTPVKRHRTGLKWGLGLTIALTTPLVVGGAGGCQAPFEPIKGIFRGSYSTIEGVDPARTPHHGWTPVDEAIAKAGTKMLIIARPIGSDGIFSRDYSLRTLQGKPGELLVSRKGVGLGIEPSEGLHIECRLGRNGDKEHERALLEEIRQALEERYAVEHERDFVNP